MVIIKNATSTDVDQWLTLRKQLWPDCSDERHKKDIDEYLNNAKKCAMLAFVDDDIIAGLLEIALRHDYVEGCKTSPVAYLEGIFVSESHRGHGIAKKLIQHAEGWSIKQGCREMGSDAELTNHISIDMHKRLGFKECGRIVHFTKQFD